MKKDVKMVCIMAVLTCLIGIAGCGQRKNHQHQIVDSAKSSSSAQAQIALPKAFDKEIDGKHVYLFTLQNGHGLKATITNYGGRLVNLMVPDKDGRSTDIIAGFSDVEGYRRSTEPYFGATIGRYANRIAKATFMLDGTKYSLFANNGLNTLHGGKKGFQDVVWNARQTDFEMLELTYLSKDMEEGFPGNLKLKVIYQLTDDNALKITYEATTDKETVINLTNHAFFNLNGEASGSILEHQLKINAALYTPIDSTLIPTGEFRRVAKTPFDFNKITTIGAQINNSDQQLKFGKGYDHNFVLSAHKFDQPVAIAQGNKSGITMKVFTDQPGLQFYSGNFMQGKNKMKGGHVDEFRTAFALETQHYPDSPNRPQFPSTVLKPGETYHSISIYSFGIVKSGNKVGNNDKTESQSSPVL